MTSAMTSAISVWLADLTYTQQSRSSDIMPAAIGCLATYVEKFINPAPECRLFKLPEKLIERVDHIVDVGPLNGKPSTLVLNGKEISR